MKLTISLIKALIDSLVGYGREIISYVESSNLTNIQTGRPFLAVTQAYNELVDGYKKARKGTYTSQLNQKDEERDNAVRSFRSLVNGYFRSDIQQEADAAAILRNILDKHGAAMLDMSHVKQNAIMNKLIQDLEQPNATTAIATLKLEQKYAKIAETQRSFESIFALSISEKAIINVSASATSVRKEFIDSMQLFLKHLEIELISNDDPKLIELCRKIEAFNIKFEQNELRSKKPDEGEAGSSPTSAPTK